MTDTQWPRYEVFIKEKIEQPYRNAGSVHAPDDELALENARDVFVRRSACVGLWVIPAAQIFTKTAEELAADAASPETPSDTAQEKYFIFQKQSQRRTETFVVHTGEVEARSPQEALALALKKFDAAKAYVWWVCPARVVVTYDEREAESWFTPAQRKTYRQPNYYRVVTLMHEIKAGQRDDERPEDE